MSSLAARLAPSTVLLVAIAGHALAQPAPKRDAKPQPAEPAATAPAPGPSAPAPAAAAWTLPPFPHPIITEILFDVPTGEAGDANGDGKRHAAGDEFVELMNPHDRPINLKDFVLTDSAGWPEKTRPNPNSPKTAEREAQRSNAKPRPDTKPDAASAGPGDKPRRGAVRFVFPSLELKPGERVVVFNGFRQEFKGPVGDTKAAPAATNEHFAGAYVLSMKVDSNFNSFSNTGDWVALATPKGGAVEVIWWGVPDFLPPEGLNTEEVPTGKESMSRATPDGPLMPHTMLPGERGRLKFSPGAFGPGDSPR